MSLEKVLHTFTCCQKWSYLAYQFLCAIIQKWDVFPSSCGGGWIIICWHH